MTKIKVLIVDDLAQVRQDLRAVLRPTGGFEIVAEAACALEAVRLAEMLVPDVVVMDLEISGWDGFEAAWQIKRRRLAKGVVGLSIKSDDRTRQLATSVGVDALVEKGTTVQWLNTTIQSVFDRFAASAI